MIFRPFGVKKIKKIGYGKWLSLTPPSPPSMEFSIYFFDPFPNSLYGYLHVFFSVIEYHDLSPFAFSEFTLAVFS